MICCANAQHIPLQLCPIRDPSTVMNAPAVSLSLTHQLHSISTQQIDESAVTGFIEGLKNVISQKFPIGRIDRAYSSSPNRRDNDLN